MAANDQDATTDGPEQPDTATMFAALLYEMKRMNENITSLCDPVVSWSLLREQEQDSDNQKTINGRTTRRHCWMGKWPVS